MRGENAVRAKFHNGWRRGLEARGRLRLKHEAKIRLELTELISLVLNETERIRAVDVEHRSIRHWMIEDVRRIHAKYQTLPFCEANRLAHAASKLHEPGNSMV
jgi:hypothetical protein